jgi:hypothetical protein
MLRAIDRMTPGDMPAFDPTLQLALNGLRGVPDAMTKHIIVISDGDPAAPTPAVLNQLIANKITVTTVIVAAHGNDPGSIATMRDMAVKTKGRFYQVTNPKALPRIYQKEARIISRPLIFEQQKPWIPIVKYTSEPISGLSGQVPPITGLVQTSPKESELVEVPILSPLPAEQPPPLLAHWTYGLGRSVAFTSDAGRKWTTQWPSWDNYAAFWSQVVRWSMRPVDNRNLTLNVRREEGKIKVVVDALDKESQFLNFLQIQGIVISPDLKQTQVQLVQTAPGRYEGMVENAEASGNYFVTLGYSGSDNVKGVVSTGVSVPYSDEYRELKSNPAILETMANLTDGQVLSWKRRADNSIDLARTLAETQPFRRDQFTRTPQGFSPLWPLFLFFAAVTFLGDVAIRRVSPDFERMRKLALDQWQKLQGREVAPPVEYMEKLKGRKAEVSDQIERSRAATRFEAPTPTEGTTPIVVDEPLLGGELHEPAPQGQAESLGGSRQGQQGQGQVVTAPGPNRFPLAILMGFVGFIASGLGAMRNGTELVASLSLGFTIIALLVGLLGAILRPRDGAWVGFALFGWFAVILQFTPILPERPGGWRDPLSKVVGWLADEIHPLVGPAPAFPDFNPTFDQMAKLMPLANLREDPDAREALSPKEAEVFDEFLRRSDDYWNAAIRSTEGRLNGRTIGSGMLALLLGLLGAAVGRRISGPPSGEGGAHVDRS